MLNFYKIWEFKLVIKKYLFCTITSIVLVTVALTGLISCGGGGGDSSVQRPPDVIIEPPPGAQDEPLGDFSISLPSNCPREVQLCVWDNGCEDGDRIRVSVNGNVEFNGQLFKQMRCKKVSVREGRNSVELFAINGTGGLNNCDTPPGVNTGAMRISGGNSQTREWRHAGGAGSSANLDVTIGPSGGSCPGTSTPVQNRPPNVVQARNYIVPADVPGTHTYRDIQNLFSDPGGQSLDYSVSSNSRSVATGVISGNDLIITVHQAGRQATVTLTATNPSGLTASVDFTVTVEHPPVQNRAPNAERSNFEISLDAGSSRTFPDISPWFSDPDGDSLSYSERSSTPSVASVDISGNRLEVTGHRAGQATVTVTARDPGGLTASVDIRVTVSTPVQRNRAPIVEVSNFEISLNAGSSRTFPDISPWFSDPDGDSLSYSERSSTPSVASVDISGNRLEVTGHRAGQATVTVTARDPGGLTASVDIRVTVSTPVQRNRAPIVERSNFEIELRKRVTKIYPDVSIWFSDPDGDFPLSYSEMSSTPSVATSYISRGRLEITAHAAGSTIVTVTVRDPDGLTASLGIRVTVLNHAPESLILGLTATVVEGSTISDIDSPTDINTWTWFYDMDGDQLSYSVDSNRISIATGKINTSTNKLEITGHAVGQATITVTATDPDGLSDSFDISVNVTAKPSQVANDCVRLQPGNGRFEVTNICNEPIAIGYCNTNFNIHNNVPWASSPSELERIFGCSTSNILKCRPISSGETTTISEPQSYATSTLNVSACKGEFNCPNQVSETSFTCD